MDKKYIIGVSGGPDSMCLLDKYKKHIELVCHVNYKKRPTVNRDETIVRDYCKSNHLKVKVLNVTKAIYHKYQKLYGNNFQNIARLIRYDFFLKNGTNVLIAHNKDDFIETALMQLKRKTKSLFLGIHKKSLYKTLHIFRPLLNKRKNELQKYCDQHNIIYGIDESNLINIYQRNKLRKEINK
jgi:tRNA(Ile)-lysidine synthase